MADVPRRPAFEVIESEDDAPARTPAADRAGLSMLALGLKTLSARAIAAVADLFTLVTVGSAFWLWLSIHEPNAYQLVSEAMYAMFVLASNWIVRKK